MTRHGPVLLLLFLHALAIAGALAFHRLVRPDLLALANAPPLFARLALTAWFVPSCAACGALVALAGAVTSGRRRLRLLAVGLTVTALPVAATILALYASLLS